MKSLARRPTGISTVEMSRLLVVIGISVTEFFSQPIRVAFPVGHSQTTDIGTRGEIAQQEDLTKKLVGKYEDDGALSGQ